MEWQSKNAPINSFIVPFVKTDMIEECIDSIWRVHSSEKHRLILIDNSLHSFDNMPSLIEKSHLYIKSYRNLGVWKSYNTGIKLATTQFITLMGDDTRLIHKKWFDDIVTSLKENTELIALNANFINEYIPEHTYTEKEYNHLLRKAQITHKLPNRINVIVCKKELYDNGNYFNEKHYPGFWKDGGFIKDLERKSKRKIRSAVSIAYIIARGTTTWWVMDQDEPKAFNYDNPMQMAEEELMHL